jgi:hypothetical protein
MFCEIAVHSLEKVDSHSRKGYFFKVDEDITLNHSKVETLNTKQCRL